MYVVCSRYPAVTFLKVQERICKQIVSFGLYILKVVRRHPISSFNPEVDQDDNGKELTTILGQDVYRQGYMTSFMILGLKNIWKTIYVHI